MFKRQFVTVFSIILTMGYISACGERSATETPDVDSGTTFAQATEQRTAHVPVLYVPAPGFAYRDEGGQLTGVTIEIMRDFKQWFERYHGISIEYEFVADDNWSQMYQRVAQADGGVFGLGNVTITAERRDEVQFSPPYLYNVAVLITPQHKNEQEPHNDSERVANYLQNLAPLAFGGTLHESRIRALRDQYHPDRDIVLVNSNQAVVEGVAKGHYSYVDAYNYHRALEEGMAIIHHPAFNVDDEQFGIIMPHSNDWAVLLTAFFAADGGYLNTSRYAQLLRYHLGSGVADILLEPVAD